MRRLVSLFALLALAGCQSVAEADPTDPARLVNEFASKLDKANARTYTAEYRLADGAAVSIVQAQKPARTAYLHAGGKLILSAEGARVCAPECVAAPGTKPAVPGFLTPAEALRAITDASLNGKGTLTSRDTTLAGQHAQCLVINGLDACVTDLGVLGSFVGEVGGQKVDLVLTRYTESVAADVFPK